MTWDQGRAGAVLQYSHCAHDTAKIGAEQGTACAAGPRKARTRPVGRRWARRQALGRAAGELGAQQAGARRGGAQGAQATGAAGARQQALQTCRARAAWAPGLAKGCALSALSLLFGPI